MSLLDKASLVITPNSYGEGTLYSAIPVNGSGDLSWGRATDAWRTNSAGLIQRTPWNLYTQSNGLTGWSVLAVTTSNSVALSPSGLLNASSIYETSATTTHITFRDATTIANQAYTYSGYFKSINGRNVAIAMSSGVGLNAVVSLSTGQVLSGTLPVTITPLPDGWYRISGTLTGTTTTMRVIIYTVDGTSLTFAGDTTKGIYNYGNQLVEGSSALDYLQLTNRQNVPRIDYSLGGCPTLLVEPQRTNLCFQSEQISTTPWTNNGGTTTLDAIASPSGIVNADKFSEDSSTGQHYIGQQITTSALTTYTMSVYAKKAERDILYIRCFNSVFGVTYCNVNFNLTTGVATGTNAAIQSVGNGWYRCSVSFTTTADLVIQVRLNMVLDGNYPGVVGNGMYIWGAQLEAGAYPTSYIPTTTASVTRNADSASKSGISSLLGQTEGTVAYKMYLNKTVGGGLQVFSTTANDSNVLFFVGYIGNTGTLTFDFYVGGVYTFSFTYATPLSVGLNRIAIVYKAGAYKLFLNGVLIGTNANSTAITNTISKLTLASALDPFNGSYYSVIAFKSALSNAECIQLTTI